MRICVCVKLVPSARSNPRFDPETKQLDRSGPGDINAADLFAVEEALVLRDQQPNDTEVVVVSMAPSRWSPALRAALSMGATRAIVVSDEVLAGSDLVVTSRVLAALISRQSPDIVLIGAQSSDGAGAMLGGALAERLRLPLVSGVQSIEVDGRVLRGVRRTSHGSFILEAGLPSVVSLSGMGNSPRYPSLKEVRAAAAKEIAVCSASDLGFSQDQCGWRGAMTTVRGISVAPNQTMPQIVRDDGRAAEWIVDFLSSRGLL
jgi:electron transfer flavoprotein beta subunit